MRAAQDGTTRPPRSRERALRDGLLQIGGMARRSGLSLRTLRHYDAIGLLPPSGRTEGGYRVYTHGDLRRLLTIRRMKSLDYSTAEMGQLLRLLDVAEGEGPAETRRAARTELEGMLEDARGRREQLAAELERADEFLRVFRERLTRP